MKITAKTSKEQLKSILGANVKAVKAQDKDLFDRIAYADKMLKKDESKVSRRDLADLAKEVMTLLGEKFVTPALAEEVKPVAENSVKKTGKSTTKKQEEPAEVPEESGEGDETAQEEPATKTEEKVDKKSAKKSLGKKKKEPKEGVTVLEGTENQKTVQMAKVFPQTIEIGESKYELAPDIKTMEDLYNEVSQNGADAVVFAYYWTKRHLRQFPYYGGLLGQPKSFPNDLDITTAVYVSDEHKVSYQVSSYTEALYAVVPADLEEEDGVRYNNGIEYQIYRAVATEVEAE